MSVIQFSISIWTPGVLFLTYWQSLTMFTKYSCFFPPLIPEKIIFPLSCVHVSWQWAFHSYSCSHATLQQKKKQTKKNAGPLFHSFNHLLVKGWRCNSCSCPKKKENLFISRHFIIFKSRCVAPSSQIMWAILLCMLLFPGLANCWLGNAQSWPSTGSRPRAETHILNEPCARLKIAPKTRMPQWERATVGIGCHL